MLVRLTTLHGRRSGRETSQWRILEKHSLKHFIVGHQLFRSCAYAREAVLMFSTQQRTRTGSGTTTQNRKQAARLYHIFICSYHANSKPRVSIWIARRICVILECWNTFGIDSNLGIMATGARRVAIFTQSLNATFRRSQDPCVCWHYSITCATLHKRTFIILYK